MRFINQIYTTEFGEIWDNQRLLAVFDPIIAGLPADAATRKQVRDYVGFQLVGQRSRRSATPFRADPWPFATRAEMFEQAAEAALDGLAAQILPDATQRGVVFDAVITTTATGNLMPGLSYRLSKRLAAVVRPDSLMVDLGNVGCTGSIKAINLADNLDESHTNVLVVSVEVPSTLAEFNTVDLDVWQGNCTFGDGAAAAWVSRSPQGDAPLAIEQIHYRQRSDTGLDLIRWGYREYYHFRLADESTFERDVKQIVSESLRDTEAGWKDEPRWAIHPAGILLLMRLSRGLGIPREAIQASAAHFREHSNMSSASILHILAGLTPETPIGGAVNLLSMGAGFNVLYGRVRRVS